MEPIYFRDLIPSISSYKKVIDTFEKALKKVVFYGDPIGEDSICPGW